MDKKVKRVAFNVQDLTTKDGVTIAVVSGTVNYKKSATAKRLTTVSFQMSLDSNAQFKRIIIDLIKQAIDMNEEK